MIQVLDLVEVKELNTHAVFIIFLFVHFCQRRKDFVTIKRFETMKFFSSSKSLYSLKRLIFLKLHLRYWPFFWAKMNQI